MPPAVPRLRILSVGGNAVSAFLSWRLQATNACDVTLVWKSGFDAVSQYGISFKSERYGNERFKPHAVVRTPEDAAASSKQPFDYVLLCVKALPDVYDIANIVESVVSPQHTCILINTTNSLGVESYLEQRFPTNVVLSLVSGAQISQLGASEFEHIGSTDIWVGTANKNDAIPAQIQSDMAEALAMTLSSGQVDCRVSTNIRQQQFERMIGPIAFQPASIVFETSNHAELIEKVGVRVLIEGVLDELLALANAYGCSFSSEFRAKTLQRMLLPQESNSTMWLDFEAKRPMEVETYLGSPLKLAQAKGISVPRIETLYATLHHVNIANRTRPVAPPTNSPQNGMQPPPPPRSSSTQQPRGGPQVGEGPMMNGNGPMKGGPRSGSRAPSINGGPPMMPPNRRGPPSGQNGYPPRLSGDPNGGPHSQRRGSLDDGNLEEFSHLMLYDDMTENGVNGGPYESAGSSTNLALRERELALRQRELQLREQELNIRRGPGGPVMNGGPRGPGGSGYGRGRGRPRPPPSMGGYDEDEEHGEDYFDPMGGRGPGPMVDPENFDMMSVTSRRTRNAPSASQIRKNPEGAGYPPAAGGRSRNMFGRGNKNRSSTRMMGDMPGLHDSIMSNPLLGYSSNRYGDVDRGTMGAQSRTNSLTASRLDELQSGQNYGGYPPSNQRRISQTPGNSLSPNLRPAGRPSPPSSMHPNGMPQNPRNSPPGMRQPMPRHAAGLGNSMAPHQVEQHAGVSTLYPPKQRSHVPSLTGTASASSSQLDSEPSAHSSQSSFGPRPPLGVR